ncbi:MAG: hypothetical protein AAF607_10785, partial [Pseudomonadota bacterium]
MKSFEIDVRDIQFLSALSKRADLDLPATFADMGLPPHLLADGTSGTLRLADYAHILQRIALKTGDETCAASSRHLMPGTTHYLLAALSCPVPLLEAMATIAKGYNLAHGGAFNDVRTTPKSVTYVIDDAGFPYAENQSEQDRYTLIESILVSLHLLFSKLAGTSLDDGLLRVYTRRPPVEKAPSFLRHWHAPVRYGAEYFAVQYMRRVGEHVVERIENPSTLTIFDIAREDSADGNGAAQHWADRVLGILESGQDGQRHIAKALGVSVATLRRRLEAENTSFRRLRAKALNARAQHLLSTR